MLVLLALLAMSSCARVEQVTRVEEVHGLHAMFLSYNEPDEEIDYRTCDIRWDSLWSGGECFVLYDDSLQIDDPIERLHTIFLQAAEYQGVDIEGSRGLSKDEVRNATCTGGFVASCTLADLKRTYCIPFFSEKIVYDLSDFDGIQEAGTLQDYDPRNLEHFRQVVEFSLSESSTYRDNCGP
ncbi:MAG: hypothetical protein AAF465_09920 [Pseudomonadota bacterium]